MRLMLGVAVSLTIAVAAHAETVGLSKLDRETSVYIQRGNTGANVQCYEYILQHLEKNDPNFKNHYYVQFDDPDIDGIAVGAFEAGDYYTCENGILRNWDAGESMVMKRFR